MAIKQELNELLMKKMDRKDFLKHVGIAVVAVTGFSAIVKTLAPAHTEQAGISGGTAGYGSSVYGGNKTS